MRFKRFSHILLAGSMFVSAPAGAAVDCLSDDELRVVVRSVFTRSIGRVMRACATQYPALDVRAREATSGFLTTYSEQMRANRLAANAIMLRVYGEGWEPKFETMLLESTAPDEARARSASREDCEDEIERLEEMVGAGNYAKVMAQGIPLRLFDTERVSIPRCQ